MTSVEHIEEVAKPDLEKNEMIAIAKPGFDKMKDATTKIT